MDEARVELGQWHEDKASKVHPGMWNLKVRLRNNLRPVEEEVDIHHPRLSSLPAARSPTGLLYLPEHLQKLLGRERGLHLRHAIEKPASRRVHRFRLVEG
jgi:hypothetical protein